MGLRKDLRSLLEGITRKPRFVSLDSLKECMTERKIKEHISSFSVHAGPEELNVIFTRPRLFAILVLLERETAVIALLADIQNDMFFFHTKEDVPPTVGDSNHRAEFFELQSQFPPMLSCKDPPQEFPGSFRPPFLDESERGPSGSYGIVHRVKIAAGHLAGHSSSELFAWKRIETRDLAVGYLQEVKTLKARHHEHLIPLVACYETPAGQLYQSQDPALHLIFPWAAMDMSNWMRPNDARPPEHLWGPEEPRRRKEYLYETILSLISAVSYLHREIDGTFTSHHDLKPQNIVLFGEQWKICDFGMTHLRSLEEGSQTERGLGSYAYHPPEYEDKNVRKHGRSFDIWSMGCIIMELAVLIAYGWEKKKLSAFEAERAKNLNRPRARDRNDVSFHNNMLIVDRWMETLAREEGSRNFTYLMDTAAKMLSMDRDARPYSWEVEIYLYEQFHPDQPGNERRAKMRGLIQAPMQNYGHNPLLRAMAESNSDLVQCLRENGWTFDSSSSAGRPITHSENNSSDVLNSFENFKLSSTQTAELFERTCEVRGYDSNHMADERRHHLAQRFTAKVSPSQRTFWEVKRILEPRHPLDPMKIFTEEIDVNHGDGDQNTALFWASWGRDATMVDVLLRYGAHLDPINKRSETPLMVASKLGHADVVERLLNETVEINYRDNHRRTALSYAADFGHTEVVRHLLENGADVQIAGELGRTPLTLAAKWGNKKIVRLLMDHLADPTSKDNEGISPLSHAMAEHRHRKWKGEAEDHLREWQDIIELLKGKDRVNEAVVREVLRQRNIEDPRP